MFSSTRTVSSLLACTLFLTACGGSGGGTACTQDYWDGTVGLCLPDGWAAVDRETLRSRGVPDDTIVAFQAEDAVSGQFPTVAVTREQLAQDIVPATYSDASIRSVTVLPGYELLDSQTRTIDTAEVKLHVFTAQPIGDEPQRRFYQISTTHEGFGYTVTATAPVSVEGDLESALKLILGSLTFVGPSEDAAE